MSDVGRHAFPEGYEVREGISFPRNAADNDSSHGDGDASENHLLNLISNAADRSLFSPEMLAGIRDWPSRYHLSPKRANLLRPFSSLLTRDVLEVGAGCGAVTRFLGENGGRIVAVEASARRARITRQRTSDLANVRVVCDRIENFAPSQPFDVVTAIGVLEYAARYSPDKPDPHVSFLRCLRDLLAPHGVVILAIENRLGLKYFAGAREDRTGGPSDGINDGRRQGSVATFGAAELARLLDRSGLRSRVWFVPCPDYKLPTAVISTPLINRHPELAATLVAQAALADPQRPADPTFSLEQSWSVLGRNGLLGELANSFLVVAGATAEAVAPYQHLDNLAWHYSVDRHPAFVKETRFVRTDDDVLVKRRSLTTAPQPNVPVRQVLAPELLSPGRNWWNELAGILNRSNWSVSQVAEWARVWTDALVRECGVPALNGETFLQHVDGRHFDLVPFNMVRDASGETHFVDQEWSLTPTVELGYLVVRGLRDSLRRVTSCAQPAANTPDNVNQLIVDVLAELGILLTRAEIERYALMESQIQAWFKGRAASEMSAEAAQAQWNVTLKQRVPAERAVLVKERQALQGNLEQARQQLGQAETTRVKLTTELEQTRENVGRQADEIARLAALRDEDERRIAEVDRELQAARDLLRDSQGETQRLAGELAGAQEELARKVSEHEAERAGLVAMKEERDNWIATLGLDLQAAHAGLQDSEARVRALVADGNAKLRALTRESDAVRDELARKVSEQEAELARLAAMSKQGDDRSAALELDLQAAQARLQDSEVRLRALAAERDAAQDELARKVSEHEAARARLAAVTSERDNRIAALGLDLQAARAGLQDSEAKLRALAAERDTVRTDATRAATERHAAARQVAQLFAEVGKLSTLKPRLDAETARARNAEDKAARLRADLEAQRAALVHREQERDAQARDAQIAKAHAEDLRATLLRQAQEIEALASKPSRFSPGAALQAVARRFSRWKRPDYRQKAWEADIIRKSRLFSALAYLKRYSDVAEAGEDPLLHYIRHGEAEGRTAHPLFDVSFYLERHPEVAQSKMTALAHYASAGAAAGFDPHPLFDTDWYLQQNPDVAATGVNPLHHYATQGWREGRDPHPAFDTSFYLANNPDVAAAGENPLVHYMHHGRAEGRPARPAG